MQENDQEDAKPVHQPEELRALLSFSRKLIGSDNFENENILIEGSYENKEYLVLRFVVDWGAIERSDAKDEMEVIQKYFDRFL